MQKTNLGLSSLALMVRNSNVVEDAMELGDNVVDLSGQIARIDRHCRSNPQEIKQNSIP